VPLLFGLAKGVFAGLPSFDAECLRSVKEIDRDVRTGLLVDPARDLDHALETAAADGHPLLLPEATALEAAGKAFIEHAHERDVHICAWTVDDAEAIERLFKLGADAVETNDPAVGVNVRDRILQR
jgi:glycerophosphoryl diester phosphodiesterase